MCEPYKRFLILPELSQHLKPGPRASELESPPGLIRQDARLTLGWSQMQDLHLRGFFCPIRRNEAVFIVRTTVTISISFISKTRVSSARSTMSLFGRHVRQCCCFERKFHIGPGQKNQEQKTVNMPTGLLICAYKKICFENSSIELPDSHLAGRDRD